MKRKLIVIATALLGTSFGAFAQNTVNTPETVQRDVNQDRRIESGLKSGSLTTGEAARLERDQSQIDRLQAKALKDGHLSPAERQQLNAAQNRASHHIAAAEHNGASGNPASASSQRIRPTCNAT